MTLKIMINNVKLNSSHIQAHIQYSQLLHSYVAIILDRDQSSFYNFVNAISAGGGGDTAEDIMGGLQAAFSRLSWGDKEVCKVKKQNI